MLLQRGNRKSVTLGKYYIIRVREKIEDHYQASSLSSFLLTDPALYLQKKSHEQHSSRSSEANLIPKFSQSSANPAEAWEKKIKKHKG